MTDAPAPIRGTGSQPVLSRAESPRHRNHLGFSGFLIVFAFAAVMLVVAQSGQWVLTRHEVLAAEPAREMLRSGDFVIPTFGGVPRLVKPPTTGWMIALCIKLTGSESERVVRFPSLVSGVALCLAVAWFAARMFGREVGVIAGCMQATSVWMILQARLAEADMPLAAAVTVAMALFGVAVLDDASGSRSACGARSAEDGRRAPQAERLPRNLARVFWFFAGLAFLIKGPVALLFTLLPALAFALVRKFRNRDARPLKLFFDPLGVPLGLLVGLSWYAVAYHRDPQILQVWLHETAARAAGDIESVDQPFLFYFYTIPWLTMPWLPYAVGVVVVRFRETWSPRAIFLALWFGVGVVLLSFSRAKHHHYIMPGLAPVTVAAAVGFVAWLKHQYAQKPKGYFIAGAIFIVGCLIAAATRIWWRQRADYAVAFVIMLLALLGSFVIFFEARRSRSDQIIATFLAALGVIGCTVMLVMPRYDTYRPSADIARFANANASPAEMIYLYDLGEAHAAFYLRFPFKRVETGESPPPSGLVLTRKSAVANFPGTVEILKQYDALISRSDHPGDELTLLRTHR